MGKIVISRSQGLNDKFRRFTIHLDDQKIGTIGDGEVKTFDVPDGNHSIKVRIRWYDSRQIEFSISGEEKKYFKVSGFKYSSIIMPLAFILVIASLILRRIMHIYYAAWLILPIFLILVYYLTIGRNDYLILKQTESW